jgi:uncharacterized protein (TIGR03437 family)
LWVNRRRWVLALGGLFAAALLATLFRQATLDRHAPLFQDSESSPVNAALGSESYVGSPMSFEINEGQADREIKYQARGDGYGIFLTRDQAIFALGDRARRADSIATRPGKGRSIEKGRRDAAPATVRMRIVGGDRSATMTGLNPLPSKSHFFIGNDQTQWRKNISHYAKVQYKNVYPGIDLVYYGNQRQLEYDFIVSPGADVSKIKLGFAEANQVRIAENGDLALATESGEMRQRKPVIYQDSEGGRELIEGRYVIDDHRRVGFEIDRYDATKPLVIDPVFVYSTYLGGSDIDIGNGIKTNKDGEAFVTGITYSVDFPTRDPLQANPVTVGEAFVTKFKANGRLLFSTYLGGDGEDVGFAISVDCDGAAYIAGGTDSKNYPTTQGAAQTEKGGRIDGFVTKISPEGDKILYSTYLGGQSDESINSIAVDSQKKIYVSGETASDDFPTVCAFQDSLKGVSDAFFTKIDPDCEDLVYSSYLGGSGQETSFGIDVDNNGCLYLTGFVSSKDFPTEKPFQAQLGGGVDAFVAKLNPSGECLEFSTYFGGENDEGGFGIGFDSSLNIYVTGFTNSKNFPIKPEGEGGYGGDDDAFLAKFDSCGELKWSKYLGGGGGDQAYTLAVTESGTVYIAGRTLSSNFPTKDPIQAAPGVAKSSHLALTATAPLTGREGGVVARFSRDGGGFMNRAAQQAKATTQTPAEGATTIPFRDGFLARYKTSGELAFSTYLGGSNDDEVFSISLDDHGSVYLTGLTASDDFPTKSAFQSTLNGTADGFVARISNKKRKEDKHHHQSVSAATYAPGVAREQIVAAFGADFCEATKSAQNFPLPTELDGLTLKVTDSKGVEHLAPLFFISTSQINYLMPAAAAAGEAQISVLRNGEAISTETLQINDVSPGLFSADATGAGPASTIALRIGPNGAQSYESLARYDGTLQKMVSAPLDLSSGDDVYLVFFGTGLRHLSSMSRVAATLGGVPVQIAYAGAQGGFAGVDQINVLAPNQLAGRGEVDFVLYVDGKASNTVKVNLK